MNLLFDIGHPAHVHFFKHPIQVLLSRGHDITVTSRIKEFTLQLLDEYKINHIPISTHGKRGLFSLAKELVQRDLSLLRIARENNIDLMAAIGGVSIAHVSRLTGIPSLVFYDTENATLQNLITYPFATQIFVPRCYNAWLPKKRHTRYPGYHELSYLHPDVFTPDRKKAVLNGLSEETATYFIRLVSWHASHDIGEKGWNRDLLEKVVFQLSKVGKVLISSESPLHESLAKYAYTGKLSDIHHLLAFCKAYIGESATMASECAVLGVPAIYAAETGRGYTDEQEKRYGLVENVHLVNWSNLEKTIDKVLQESTEHWQQARSRLLDDTINVSNYIVDCIDPGSCQSTSYKQRINS